MKLSLQFREETHQNPLLRAKIPVTILGFPFLSAVSAGDSSDLSFSLRTHFLSGPSLSFSYHPTSTVPSGKDSPFCVSLKSGIGAFGSPVESPLTFNVRFNVFPSNPSLIPSFSLLIKPQLGNFFLRKSVCSGNFGGVRGDGAVRNGELSNGSGLDSGFGNGFGLNTPLALKNMNKEHGIIGGLNGVLSEIFVAARTSMPLTNRAAVNFRWGVEFPAESNLKGSKLGFPALVVNKIGLERVDEAKYAKEKKKNEEAKANVNDLELLKGLCTWMKRDMEALRTENVELKQALESMRMQFLSTKTRGQGREGVGKRPEGSNSVENSSDFEKWRSGKGGVEENGMRESKKSANRVADVENELQKAIKAASS